MILNLLNEAIENQKVDKFYKQFYETKLTEDDFLKVVSLDISSFQANNFSNPLVGVGQLASAIFLPDYVGNGKAYIDSNLDRVKQASSKFITERNTFTIKNPKQFTSTEQFVNYILDGIEPSGGVQTQTKPQKKELTADEKLEQLRVQQLPNIPDLDTVKQICLLDVENNIESGQPGDVARGLLLPYYNRSLSGKFNYPEGKSAEDDQNFLNQKKRTKMAIIAYYGNKTKKINSFETINDFLDEYAPQGVTSKSALISVLQEFLIDGVDYKIIGRTPQHDIIQELTKYAAWVCEYPQTPIDKWKSDGLNISNRDYPSDATTAGRRIIYAFAQNDRRSREAGGNNWCTGWSSSHFSTYTGGSEKLYAVLANSGDVRNISNNFQISINSSGEVHDIESGENNHVESESRKWERVKNGIFRKDPEVFRILYNIPEFSKNYEMKNYGRINNLSATDKTGVGNLYEEVPPFIYNGPEDVTEYILKHDGDVKCVHDIDTLIIAEGVTKIPAFQFENWEGLIDIQWPNSLEKIGSGAFKGCANIQRIKKFNDGLKEIGRSAFENCSSLKGSILLPNSIEIIREHSFDGCNVKFRLKSSIKDIPGKKIAVPADGDEGRWWRTNGRIIIAD